MGFSCASQTCLAFAPMRSVVAISRRCWMLVRFDLLRRNFVVGQLHICLHASTALSSALSKAERVFSMLDFPAPLRMPCEPNPGFFSRHETCKKFIR